MLDLLPELLVSYARSALKRFGALFVDSLVFATIGSVIYMVPFVGFVLVPLISSSRELLLASWGDRPSPGRALFGLRCVTLSPPEQEASSLFLRQSLPQVLFLAAQGFAIVPFLGHAVGLSYLFALLAAPLQTLSGSGRTWIDYVANTQVIDEADLAQAARNA